MDANHFLNYIDYYLSEHPFVTDDNVVNDINHKKENNIPMVFLSKYLDASDNNIYVSFHNYSFNHIGAHSHDYFELIYVARGAAHQIIENETKDLNEGDICILNPSVIHNIFSSSENDILINILIKKSLFKESFLCLISENYLMSNFFISSLFTLSEQQKYLLFSSESNQKSAPLIEALVTEFLGQKIGYKKATECYLALLLTELLREHRKVLDKENYANMGNHTLTEILTYINQNKATATLDSVAEAFHYNASYLSTLLKTHTNKSFSAILQQAKLQEACYYLKNTSMSIDEITTIVGYSDRNYFHRVFKKSFGMTPNDYRNT